MMKRSKNATELLGCTKLHVGTASKPQSEAQPYILPKLSVEKLRVDLKIETLRATLVLAPPWLLSDL